MIKKNSCEFKDHKNETIVGLCLFNLCPRKPDYCHDCLKKIHKHHLNQCKTFSELKTILKQIKDETTDFQLNLTKQKLESADELTRAYINRQSNEIKELDMFILLITKKQFLKLTSYSNKIKLYKSWYMLDNFIIEEEEADIQYFDNQQFQLHCKRGLHLKETNKWEEALQEIDQALFLKPNDCDLICLKSRVLRQLKKFEVAYEVIASGNQSPQCINNKSKLLTEQGFVLLEIKSYEESLQCVERAIEMYPSSTSHICKGLILFELNQIDEAIQCLQNAIELKLEENYKEIGDSLKELKLLAQGLHDYFAELLQKFGQKHQSLSLKAQDKHYEALKILNKILLSQQYDAENLIKIGSSLQVLRYCKESIAQDCKIPK